MNIFILDDDPVIAASYMCDKHIPKMIIESFQMLCTALHETGNGTENMYRPAYQHHPCTLWASASKQNWFWLLSHAEALCDQYEKRYERIHKSARNLLPILPPNFIRNMPDKGLTPFAQAMPDQYKDDSAIWAYRAYYLGEKAYFAKWQKGVNAPWWWHQHNVYTEPMEFRVAHA